MSKCKAMHVGANNPNFTFALVVSEFAATDQEGTLEWEWMTQ